MSAPTDIEIDLEGDILQTLRSPVAASRLTFLGEQDAVREWPALQIVADAASHASGLLASGVGRGDRVVLVSDDSRELAGVFLGCVAVGAVPAILPTHPRRDGGVGVSWPHAARLVEELGFTTCVVTERAAAEGRELLGNRCRVVAVEETKGAEFADLAVADPDAPCFVQLSSGSGGTPKAIVHTHRRVLRYLCAKRTAQPIAGDEVVVSWLPLYHDLGLVSGVLTPLVLGVRSVLMSPFHWVRNPAILLRAITEYGGTLCFMPNFALAHLARAVRQRDLDGVDLSSLRAIVCGAEPVQPRTLDEFRARFEPLGLSSRAIRIGYGMAEMVEGVTVTEAGSVVRIDALDRRSLEDEGRAVAAAADSRLVVSCGRPMPSCEVSVVDESGSELGDGAVGEIRLRSPYMLDGYLGAPELDAKTLKGGWLHTGDLGYLSDGELFVVGRSKDLIIVGGRNIAPEDFEALVDGVGGLRAGRVVAFGVSDAASGTEKPVLVCELAEADPSSNGAIERELRRRSIERLDVALGRVVFVPPGWLTKTSSGKLARPANRERYLAELAAAEVRP